MSSLVRIRSFWSAVSDNIPLQSVPHELTTLEREAIVSHLEAVGKLARMEMRTFEFSLPGRPPLFIKQGSDMQVEASTQHFFHLLATSDESAPRVPKVFDAFPSRMGSLLVMEKIAAPTLSDCDISEEEAVELAASAVKWLLDQLPWVPDACFGRISSIIAPVWHQFFKDHEAPQAFAHSDELAEYVSRVCISHLTNFTARY